jgi:Fe-S cluster assembly protein SufD
MANPAVKQDPLAARIEGLTLPDGAGWANDARGAALSRLTTMGLPRKRDEYWKYSDPTTVNAPEAPRAGLFVTDEAMPFSDTDRLKIVFVDGVYDADASDDLTMEGVEIERLSDALARDIHWARDYYGVLETRGQTPVERPLAALNTAFATDGVVIRATGKAAKPISLIYLHKSETSDAILHHLVKVEEGASVTVLENGPAAARFSKCM